MKIEITKVVSTVHAFGMDTVHLYTQFNDPCDPNEFLTLSFKCPRNTGEKVVREMFKKSSVVIETHNFSNQRD